MSDILKKLNLFPDKIDYRSWLISFLIINFAFLYHTLNFIWGNHDVKFVKEELLWSSGLFEGRFTQFIPYRLMMDGQILPILNNLVGFGFLTLALWLLAKYWNVKKSCLNYVLFISFFATQPYTLSWLYFSFITISCLLWTFLAVLGLYLAERVYSSSHKIALSFISISCFYLTLGGYPPVINMFLVCLGGKILIEYVFAKKEIKQLFVIYKYTIINILLAAILFKLSLKIFNPDNVYNLELEALNNWITKFFYVIKIAFNQFFIAVPFMEKEYKFFLAFISFIAICGVVSYSNTYRTKVVTVFLVFAVILSTALTTFLVVPHTEYVSRIDFYGFAFLYALFIGILLSFSPQIYRSLGIVAAVVLIVWNILNDYQALKIWQQGRDAEFQILEDLTSRIENNHKFDSAKKYRFYQVGDLSLRPNYYHGKYDYDDVFLLSIPYLAMWQGANLIEFYSSSSFINRETPLLPEDITSDVYKFFMNEAKPWPHKNSVYLNDHVIIIIYNQVGLDEFRAKLQSLLPFINK